MAENPIFGKTFSPVEVTDVAGKPKGVTVINNVSIVDPNPTNGIVPPEDLFIYVNLKANQKSKTLITQTTQGVNVESRAANTVNIGIPQEKYETVSKETLFKTKPFLTTDWTEIGGNKVDVNVD